MRTTKHLKRRLIVSACKSMGYVASGNLVYERGDMPALVRGEWRFAVTEQPERHSPRVVRAAELLAGTYTS
jgi:hypothetical protein